MSVATFRGTVVDCRTRFSVEKPTTAFVTHFDASWILTVAIDAAAAGLLAGEVSFAIHSPVQLLFDSAEECIGKAYGFAVDLDDTGRPRWATLRRG